MSEWQDEAMRLWRENKDKPRVWPVIGEVLTRFFPGEDARLLGERARKHIRGTGEYKAEQFTQGPVGVFGDVHFPFDHPNYLRFLQDTFRKHKVSQIICTGDLVDNHALSRHQTEGCAKGPYDELDMALVRVRRYARSFPKLKMCIGNHDTIIKRQAATVGIGARFLKPYDELLELPSTWEIADEHMIDGVLYKHGINCLGKDGALNAAIQERMSTVVGHSHSFGGCKYSANKREIIFGMNVGCGIDIDAYAFAYGEHAKFRPTLGCGIVYNSGHATFVPMGEQYFRSYKKGVDKE